MSGTGDGTEISDPRTMHVPRSGDIVFGQLRGACRCPFAFACPHACPPPCPKAPSIVCPCARPAMCDAHSHGSRLSFLFVSIFISSLSTAHAPRRVRVPLPGTRRGERLEVGECDREERLVDGFSVHLPGAWRLHRLEADTCQRRTAVRGASRVDQRMVAIGIAWGALRRICSQGCWATNESQPIG